MFKLHIWGPSKDNSSGTNASYKCMMHWNSWKEWRQCKYNLVDITICTSGPGNSVDTVGLKITEGLNGCSLLLIMSQLSVASVKQHVHQLIIQCYFTRNGLRVESATLLSTYELQVSGSLRILMRELPGIILGGGSGPILSCSNSICLENLSAQAWHWIPFISSHSLVHFESRALTLYMITKIRSKLYTASSNFIFSSFNPV